MSQSDYWRAQTVLVTGASRGIGQELARRFSQLGARVAGTYLSNEDAARQLEAELGAERTRMYRCDVSDEEQVTALFADVQKSLGPITILVNNGGQTRDGLLMTMKTEDWRAVLGTHLDGAFFCCRQAIRHMLTTRRGRIVNVSSVAGVKGTAGQTNYSAAKAGLIGLTKALSREMGKKNITVNAVVLGAIDTDMLRAVSNDVLEGFRNATSLKRIGKVSEVADLVEFLTGPQADYLTGQAIALDGGML